MNNFCMQKSITKEIKIGDKTEEVKFYAIPHGVILKMKTAAKPLAKLIATMMTDTSHDFGTDHTTVPSESAEGSSVNFVSKEISASLASLRHKQSAEAINEILDTILSNDTQDLLSEIVVRSASDMFDKDDAPKIADNMDTGTLIQFLSGAFEASASGVAGLGKFLSPQTLNTVKAALASVKGGVAGA